MKVEVSEEELRMNIAMNLENLVSIYSIMAYCVRNRDYETAYKLSLSMNMNGDNSYRLLSKLMDAKGEDD